MGGGSGGPPPGNFLKIYVSENAFQAILKPSENAFQAILKPFFPYSITSILSKVRHSNSRCVCVGGGYSDIFIRT